MQNRQFSEIELIVFAHIQAGTIDQPGQLPAWSKPEEIKAAKELLKDPAMYEQAKRQYKWQYNS